ncbi:type III-A CRISPR-associated CARF protein Csm6 [Anaerofustis stercorihominis]|uniref:type III-A CRISPR-associated CARF protein Csm6 n=1 Tax=Anaerofustis stercorihominis TaxID=214853 RepID=UPI0014851BA4|nr:hypothetical protein [Anaerofustis stercorihominis]
MKKILFTPIGGTDPIRGSYDGAFIHISRVFKPDKVYMYLSKEMVEKEESDHRYTKTLELLSKHIEKNIEYELIKRPNLVDVHIFDDFFDEFKEIIKRIRKENPESEIYVNVSSGSPAMKSSVQILSVLGEENLIPIQVSTPVKRMNDGMEKDYDVELMWECNIDNEENFENRCKKSKKRNLAFQIKADIIKEQIRKYNYSSAIDIANGSKEFISDKFMDLLNGAYRRLQLDFANMTRYISKYNEHFLPINRREDRDIIEYLLSLKIKIEKKEYADFIRAISPLFLEISIRIFEKYSGLNIDDFTFMDNKTKKWSDGKLRNGDSRVLDTINGPNALNGKFNTTDTLKSVHFKFLIDGFCTNDDVKDKINEVRDVESKVRNTAAHQIKSVTDEYVKQTTGYTSNEVFNMIVDLLKYTNIPFSKEYLNSYDEMNKKIIDEL